MMLGCKGLSNNGFLVSCFEQKSEEKSPKSNLNHRMSSTRLEKD